MVAQKQTISRRFAGYLFSHPQTRRDLQPQYKAAAVWLM